MDLSKMTRDELEREAARRGVREVTHLTRAQLIRAIEAPPAAGAIDTAKAIFRGVLGVARTLRGRSSSPPPPPAPTPPPAPASTPAPARAATEHPPGASRAGGAGDAGTTPGTSTTPLSQASAKSAGSAGERSEDTQRLRAAEAPAALPASPLADASTTAGPPAPPSPRVDEPEPRPTLGRTEDTRKMKLPTSEADSGVIAVPAGLARALAQGDPLATPRDTAVTKDLGPLRDEILVAAAEADALSKAARRRELATTLPIRPPLEGEPIPTRTMARLLHEQGHHRRALAILENLAAQRPHDPDVEADLANVRRALGAARTLAPAGTHGAPSPRAELVTMLLADKRVLLAWGLSDDSLASARSVGASGTLVARVLVLAPGSSGAVGRTQTDKEVEASGEWAIGPIAVGSFVTAAVGFRDGERFVSVASAPVLDVA